MFNLWRTENKLPYRCLNFSQHENNILLVPQTEMPEFQSQKMYIEGKCPLHLRFHLQKSRLNCATLIFLGCNTEYKCQTLIAEVSFPP